MSVQDTFNVSMTGGKTEPITTIPEGAASVEVNLTGPSVLDLSLNAGDTEIVDWNDGQISGPSGGSTTYKGTEISWSGYSGNSETLAIDGTVPEELSLNVDAFSSGSGEVEYSWDSNNEPPQEEDNEPPQGEDNEPPQGEDDTLTATAGEALTVSAEELLANDSDPDGDDLNIVAAGDTENGDLNVEPASGPASSLTFTPDEGVDEAFFQYVVSDGDKKDITDVDLEVQPADGDGGSGGAVDNTAQVSASGDEQVMATIPEGATDVEVNLTGSSSLDLALDASDTEIVDWADGQISGSNGGSTNYQGADISWSGYSNPESLTIDGPVPEDLSLILDPFASGGSGELSYSWDSNKEPPQEEDNEPPQGKDDTLTATAGEPLTIPAEELLANDTDPDGSDDELVLYDASEAVNGSLDLELQEDPSYEAKTVSSVTFTPETDVSEAEFKYVVRDGGPTPDADLVEVDLDVQPNPEVNLAEHDDSLSADGDKLTWEEAIKFIEGEQNWFFDGDSLGGLSPADITVSALSSLAGISLGPAASSVLGLAGSSIIESFEKDLAGDTALSPHIIPLEDGYEKTDDVPSDHPDSITMDEILTFQVGDAFDIAGTIAPGSDPDEIHELTLEQATGNNFAPLWEEVNNVTIDPAYNEETYEPYTVDIGGEDSDFYIEEPGIYRLSMDSLHGYESSKVDFYVTNDQIEKSDISGQSSIDTVGTQPLEDMGEGMA